MATTHTTRIRTEPEPTPVREVLLAVAYAGGIVATVAAATGAAALLAGFTAGLGQFVLLAAAWLVVVSASPEIGAHLARRLAEVDFRSRAPRSSRAVTAVVAYLVSK